MSKIFYLLLSITMCLVIASCSDEHVVNMEETPEQPGDTEKPDNGKPDGDDNPEGTVIPFWEHTHLAFFGMTGSVNRVVETVYVLPGETDESYNMRPLDMNFDASGRMTYYDITGIERTQTRAFDQELPFSCSYQYDEKGRLVKAICTPQGGTAVVYNLTYGEHTNYVPLIFPLGKMKFFLVKGLRSIAVKDGDIAYTYTYDGEKASYQSAGWISSKTEYVYASGSPYPAQKVVTTDSWGGVNVETTLYTYAEDGGLLKTDVKLMTGETEAEHIITRYVGSRLLLPASVAMDVSGFTYDFTYTYNPDNRLSQIGYTENKGAEDEIIAKEQYNYLTVDKNGNWTDSKQLQSEYMGLVLNQWHVNGWVGIRRQISYY